MPQTQTETGPPGWKDLSPFVLESVVVAVDLKEALGVVAGGADLRGGSAHHDVAAVAALPNLDLALLKDLGGLHTVSYTHLTLPTILLV